MKILIFLFTAMISMQVFSATYLSKEVNFSCIEEVTDFKLHMMEKHFAEFFQHFQGQVKLVNFK
jgi:hypothetical protein